MGMTIDEAIATIKGERWICCQEKYIEAINLIENVMRKYQKIQEIIADWRSDGDAFEMSEPYWLRLISEVVEDGKID